MCECLLKVVYCIFMKKGYVVVSVEDIVVVVGYMWGVFYLNFCSKFDLLLELLECDYVVVWVDFEVIFEGGGMCE